LVGDNAEARSEELPALGHRVLTGGTDNHMVLVDIRAAGLTGIAAEHALEDCGILVNRNKIPGDTLSPTVGAGLRFGTNIVSQRGMGPAEVRECARLVHEVLSATKVREDVGYELDGRVRASVRARVDALCA